MEGWRKCGPWASIRHVFLLSRVCRLYSLRILYIVERLLQNMQPQNTPMVVRFTQEDSSKMERMIQSGFAINRTDYIRRAVREQIIRDAESMKI